MKMSALLDLIGNAKKKEIGFDIWLNIIVEPSNNAGLNIVFPNPDD